MKVKTLGIGIGLAAGGSSRRVVVASRAQRSLLSPIATPLDPGVDRLSRPATAAWHGPERRETGTLTCGRCGRAYPIVDGIPHFIEPAALTGLNRRFSWLYDWFSWFYRLFSKVAFAFIGMPEEAARREVLDRLEPGGGRVLEVSIGPGVNLPYLVGRPDVGEVHGLDISLGQLRRCQAYLRRQGWAVPLYLGNAEELPFGDATFDGVFHIGGINFFNDKPKAIAEMIRVASPGTRIVICDENERGARPTSGRSPASSAPSRATGRRSRPPWTRCRRRCRRCVSSTCGRAGCTAWSSANPERRDGV